MYRTGRPYCALACSCLKNAEEMKDVVSMREDSGERRMRKKSDEQCGRHGGAEMCLQITQR